MPHGTVSVLHLRLIFTTPRAAIALGWLLLWLSPSSGAHPFSIAERDADAYATLAALSIPPDATVLLVEPLDNRYIKALNKTLNRHGRILVDQSGKHAGMTLSPTDLTPTPNGPRIDIDRPTSSHPRQGADWIIIDRALHRWLATNRSEQQLRALTQRLNPHGQLVLIDYRQDAQRPDDPKAALGYVTERLAIEKAASAGLELAEALETNANPHDIKDYDQGAYTLPPVLRLGNKDRDRYMAIGEADRFTLRFHRATKSTP